MTPANDLAAASHFIDLDEAEQRFGLGALFDLRAYGDEPVLVFDGDIEVMNVPLDYFSLDFWVGRDPGADPAFGMVVNGDLTVRTHVGNWTTDFGPFLLVRGHLRTQGLADAGSEIHIEGDLEAAQTIYGFGNHGALTVGGDATAEAVVVEEHLMRFHGGLTAEVAAAGNFLRIADPNRWAVTEWTGHVADLHGEPHEALGTGTDRALSHLHPLCWDLDRAPIITYLETGTSLLRRNHPQRAGRPKGPISDLDLIRYTLIEGGCPERTRFDGGFVASRKGRRTEVWADEADEPDDETEPFDEGAALRACANVLTAAGFTVEHDSDEGLLRVANRGRGGR